ncbi:MAG: hypothetical protein AB7P16_26955 [Bradyrhizobium sp.]|uniref:hypothetical protein n=1 Tax=Bradyrhizobium sp. TaxID=376 RepID=UPI003D0E7900
MDEADVLRAKACWRWVRNRSGLGNPEIEELLTPESVHRLASKIERPRKWDRYEKGEMCPSDDGTPQGTVGSVEVHFPGFRAFYQHPLWPAISRKEIDAAGVTALMRALPSIEALLFQLTSITRSFGDPILPTVPPRRRAFDDEVFKLLRDEQSLDSLAAFLLMVREATIIGSPDYRSSALQGYRRQMPWLRNDPVFAPIATELCDLVDRRFMDHLFAHPNQRLNIYIVTKNLTDDELK